MKFLHLLGSSKASKSETKAKVCGPTFEDSITERTFSSSDGDSSSTFSLFGASSDFSSPKPTQKSIGEAEVNGPTFEDSITERSFLSDEDSSSALSLFGASGEFSSQTKDCANGGEGEESAPSTAIVDGGTAGEENSTVISMKEDAGQYGYGEDTTNDVSKYEYDDAPPTPTRTLTSKRSTLTRSVSRRSSLKQENCPRRASIQFGAGVEIQVYLPGQRQIVRKRNSITFNESVYVRNVEPISSLTDEPEALWIQCDEYREMKTKMKRLASLVDTGNTGGRNYCVRGLEPFMKANAQVRLDTKNQAWDTVLDEQCRQEDEEIFDDETLANSYKLTSVASKMIAAERAKEDELAIKEYTRSTRLMMRRMSM
jgi:hypothetical protein